MIFIIFRHFLEMDKKQSSLVFHRKVSVWEDNMKITIFESAKATRLPISGIEL